MTKLKLAQHPEVLKTQNSGKILSKKCYGLADDVSSQIQSICTQVVKDKLKRDGLLTRKIFLKNSSLWRSSSNISTCIIILNRTSIELERIIPRTFSNVTLSNTEAENAAVLAESIGRTLLKQDITWAKIICFLAISSALSCECVKRHIQLDVIQSVVDSTATVIFEEAGSWIEREGGWSSLNDYIRPVGSVEHLSILGWLGWLTGFLLTVHFTALVFKIVSRQIHYIL